MSRGRQARGRRRSPRPQPSRPEETVSITHIAQQGDGEGRLADGTRVFAPLTLAGETVRLKPGAKRGEGLAAQVIEVLDARPRAEPICTVFGRCGGCQLQHMPDADYAAWKTGAVATALSRHGIDAPMRPLRRAPVQSRRRATLGAVMTADGPVLGFNEALSPRVVDIDRCPLLVAPLAALLTPLRGLLGQVLRPPARADVALSVADDGAVDVIVSAEAILDLAAREALAVFAERNDIARLAWAPPGEPPEPVSIRRDAVADLGGVAVVLPLGGFQQPSREGEAILQALVMEGIGDAARVADLYCGIGTFALPLASAGKHVIAADGDAPAIQALNQAAGRAGLGGRVEARVCDLKDDPVPASGLAGVDAVVFDPPRAGAKPQAECIAESDVARVVAVSCNPATLGRDLRILIDGGFDLETVTPVDQFPMSHHVEAVAVLRRSG